MSIPEDFFEQDSLARNQALKFKTTPIKEPKESPENMSFVSGNSHDNVPAPNVLKEWETSHQLIQKIKTKITASGKTWAEFLDHLNAMPEPPEPTTEDTNKNNESTNKEVNKNEAKPDAA